MISCLSRVIHRHGVDCSTSTTMDSNTNKQDVQVHGPPHLSKHLIDTIHNGRQNHDAVNTSNTNRSAKRDDPYVVQPLVLWKKR